MRLLIFMIFFFPNEGSNNSYSCELYFKNINILDFSLGVNYLSFEEEMHLSYTKSKLENEDILINFEEEIFLINKKRIIYHLTFRNGELISYTFKIKIENNEGLEYFEKILKMIDRNKNSFIKGEKYAYMETSKECKKFFRIQEFDSTRYIYGGINRLY